MGLLLRSLKEYWVTCLLVAAASEARAHQQRGPPGRKEAAAAAARQPSRELYRVILGALGLDECWRVRPHLDGVNIIRELGLPRGPLVGTYLDDQARWMLLHPDGTREECAAHLRERQRK